MSRPQTAAVPAAAPRFSVGELLLERNLRRYRGDGTVDGDLEAFRLFCANEIWIAHPLGRRRLVLRDPQLETARAFLDDSMVLILKARQIGFTTLTLAFALWKALFHEDYSIIMLSRREDDAKAALGMAKLAYDALDPDLKARLPRRLDNSASKMTFGNGSVIESHPAANNPARGRTASLMILDEWAFMPNPDDAWASISPAADIGGRIIALSTANGWGNTFHRMWTEAVKGDNGFRAVFYPWDAVPERNQDWYEVQQRRMLPWQLAQEYPSSPEEAFIQSGNPVFDVDALKALTVEEPLRGVLEGEHVRHRDLRIADHGPLAVYEEPKSGATYVLGVDVAQGLEHGDYSSVHVLNLKSGLLAAHWHGHIDPDLFGYEVAALGWWFHGALAGIEINNHGLTTAKTVQRLGYPNIYYRKRLGRRRETISEELGWMTTRGTKPFIVDGLNAALRNGEITVLDDPTRQELIQYQRAADGSTSGSPHDDRVISLAIAVEMRRHAHEATADKQIVVPRGSFAYELEQMDRDARLESLQGTALGRYNVRGHR